MTSLEAYRAGMEYVIDTIISSHQDIDEIIAELMYEMSIIDE